MFTAKSLLIAVAILLTYYVEIALPLLFPQLVVTPRVTDSLFLAIVANLRSGPRIFFSGLIGLLQDDLYQAPVGTHILLLTTISLFQEWLERFQRPRSVLDKLIIGVVSSCLLFGVQFIGANMLQSLNGIGGQTSVTPERVNAAIQMAFSFLVFVFLQLLITIGSRFFPNPDADY